MADYSKTIRLVGSPPAGYAIFTKTTLSFPEQNPAQVETLARNPDIVTSMLQADLRRAFERGRQEGFPVAGDPKEPLIYTIEEITTHVNTPVGASAAIAVWYKMSAA